ncbi:hypothetical protein F3K40_35700 [Streptomyces sp. LBUM 1478]|nr:hypothetical protein [Streptomyces sp. LBUM 1478]
MPLAERLVRDLIARPRAEDPLWLNGLAALIGAVGQQSRVLHVQLLHEASPVVRALDAQHAMRGHGPRRTTPRTSVTRCSPPSWSATTRRAIGSRWTT